MYNVSIRFHQIFTVELLWIQLNDLCNTSKEENLLLLKKNCLLCIIIISPFDLCSPIGVYWTHINAKLVEHSKNPNISWNDAFSSKIPLLFHPHNSDIERTSCSSKSSSTQKKRRYEIKHNPLFPQGQIDGKSKSTSKYQIILPFFVCAKN